MTFEITFNCRTSPDVLKHEDLNNEVFRDIQNGYTKFGFENNICLEAMRQSNRGRKSAPGNARVKIRRVQIIINLFLSLSDSFMPSISSFSCFMPERQPCDLLTNALGYLVSLFLFFNFLVKCVTTA